jgi:hypothetical protein
VVFVRLDAVTDGVRTAAQRVNDLSVLLSQGPFPALAEYDMAMILSD